MNRQVESQNTLIAYVNSAKKELDTLVLAQKDAEIARDSALSDIEHLKEKHKQTIEQLQSKINLLETNKNELESYISESTVELNKLKHDINILYGNRAKILDDISESQRQNEFITTDLARRVKDLNERESVINRRELIVNQKEQEIANNANLLNL